MKEIERLPTGAGYHDIVVSLDDTPVKVTLYLPENLQPRNIARGLVMALHYGGEPHGHYGRGLLEQLVVPAWGSAGVVFAAPVTLGGDWKTGANTRMVVTLADRLSADLGLPAAARWLTGYSLGAMGCWHFLTTRPGVFRRILPVAGPVPAEVPDFQTPVHVLHSDADQLFPASDVVTGLETLKAQGNPVTWQVLSGVTHFQLGGYREALSGLQKFLD
jgi:predicted peptidase